MNYLDLVQDFFEEFFDKDYLIVSVPFVIIISGLSSGITSYIYRQKIKEYKNQYEIMVQMNYQHHQTIHNLQQQAVTNQPTASAPPMAYLYSYV